MATKSKKAENNLNALSAEELNSQLADATLRLNKLKFSHAITPIDNPLTIRAERKTIAKIQTAKRRQQLGF